MTITDIYNQFTVNEHGIIEDAGQYQGCKYFMPYYWNRFLNGDYTRLEGNTLFLIYSMMTR